MPFVSRKIDNGLVGGFSRLFDRTPLFRSQRYNYRYSEVLFAKPADETGSQKIIEEMHSLGLHPGAYEWRNTTSYAGAVFSAIHNVDIIRSEKDPEYNLEKFHAVREPYPTWESTLAKTALSFAIMTMGLPIPFFGRLGVSTDFARASFYLGINALRNVVSDLSAKHGLDIKECVSHLEHIKWSKLTDSILTTSICFPILAVIKESLHQGLDSPLLEPFIVAPCIFLTDAIMQFSFRKIRGFSSRLALRETLRPAVGDAGAFACWQIIQQFIPGMTLGTYSYLVTRKIFSELYSGHFEAAEKRREKTEDRVDALSRIFDLSRYKMADPAAMAAINLVYIASVKSVTRFVLRDIIRSGRFNGEDISRTFRLIHDAMADDSRIKRSAAFIFPFDDQSKYLDWMITDFARNRAFYFERFKMGCPVRDDGGIMR